MDYYLKVHRVNKFNQKAWLNLYINMNTELKKSEKNDFEKHFFKVINNLVYEKPMENVRKKQRHQACNDRSKKEFWYQNQTVIQHFSLRKSITNRKEINQNFHE